MAVLSLPKYWGGNTFSLGPARISTPIAPPFSAFFTLSKNKQFPLSTITIEFLKFSMPGSHRSVLEYLIGPEIGFSSMVSDRPNVECLKSIQLICLWIHRLGNGLLGNGVGLLVGGVGGPTY